jgi:monothiol glutaredoxin
MTQETEILDDIRRRIADNRIMVFMKGTPDQPMCGFSASVVEVFKRIGRPFGAMDILPDPAVRLALSEHTQWPTIPQVFIGGEFIGGCDIVCELFESGELQKKVDAAFTG